MAIPAHLHPPPALRLQTRASPKDFRFRKRSRAATDAICIACIRQDLRGVVRERRLRSSQLRRKATGHSLSAEKAPARPRDSASTLMWNPAKVFARPILFLAWVAE